ncbi:11832_t:CDS:2 [Diversispora eburnea]|uniref:11832_t:CDS:1 n=1 Tax=Diversispora eburnea TaxID=1213867 RepID=A0A9N8W6B0_9GLOM|nr:11832_t:CDS:2 [Diversispora eburnea]
MKLIGSKKFFSIGKLFKRSSSKVRPEDKSMHEETSIQATSILEENIDINLSSPTQEEASIKQILITETTSVTEEKSVVNSINMTQKESSIKPKLIIDAKSVLKSFEDLTLSNINFTEVKSILKNINTTQNERSCELTSISDTTLKFSSSDYNEEERINDINKILGEMQDYVEKTKKHQERSRQIYYYSKEWKSEKKYQ